MQRILLRQSLCVESKHTAIAVLAACKQGKIPIDAENSRGGRGHSWFSLWQSRQEVSRQEVYHGLFLSCLIVNWETKQGQCSNTVAPSVQHIASPLNISAGVVGVEESNAKVRSFSKHGDAILESH